MRILITVLALLLFAACGGADTGPHKGKGVVAEIRHAEQQVVLDHEEIPGVMKAMTMGFEVTNPGVLDGVETGQAVDFELTYKDGNYFVSALEPR